MMGRDEIRFTGHKRRSLAWCLGLAVALVLPGPLTPNALAADGFRLPPDFRPPVEKCPGDSNCDIRLERDNSGFRWHLQCGEPMDAETEQRMETLRRRERDVLVILISPARRAQLSSVVSYLNFQRFRHLVDDNRIRVIPLKREGRRATETEMAQYCAQSVTNEDGFALVPNTAFVFFGDASEAPSTNPCKDDRWNDGVKHAATIEACRNFHPQKASVGRVWPGADGVSKSVI